MLRSQPTRFQTQQNTRNPSFSKERSWNPNLPHTYPISLSIYVNVLLRRERVWKYVKMLDSSTYISKLNIRSYPGTTVSDDDSIQK